MFRFVVITVITCLAFLIEFVLFNFFGKWIHPNLLLLVVVFFNLYFESRQSFYSAFLAGIIKDSFSMYAFGIHTFTFVVCVYLTVFIKRYLFRVGSRTSKGLIVFIVSLFSVLMVYALNMMSGVVIPFVQIFKNILIPEVCTTTIVALFVFERLRKLFRRLAIEM